MSTKRSGPSAREKRESADLPAFIEPMLAVAGQPFDSADHSFEIKWDGTRALALIDGGRAAPYRLPNRRRNEMVQRYPELEVLRRLPAGTALDGEIVVLKGGKPDFAALQRREQVRSEFKIKQLARLMPATLVAFDLLYRQSESVMHLPCQERRQMLAEILGKAASPQLVFSDGIVGDGIRYFNEACRLGLEGVVAKRLDSTYRPGKRSSAWVKIKRQEMAACAIIGFVPEGADDFAALILAAEVDGQLRYVGKVGSGFDQRLRQRLSRALWSRQRASPIVPTAKVQGIWVEPGLYCTVQFMERTSGGQMRAPVFGELYGDTTD
jgi:DNA ligase D-like protein (predicted ligase)